MRSLRAQKGGWWAKNWKFRSEILFLTYHFLPILNFWYKIPFFWQNTYSVLFIKRTGLLNYFEVFAPPCTCFSCNEWKNSFTYAFWVTNLNFWVLQIWFMRIFARPKKTNKPRTGCRYYRVGTYHEDLWGISANVQTLSLDFS